MPDSDPGVPSERVVRVFISSPSDVRPERLIAERVVKRMAREFAYHFRLEPVLWEREPLLATHHFQDLIVPPRETDVVVTVLWSRLGVPLPEDKFRGAISQAAVTGTEWEFEDAFAGFRLRGLPDLLLYRKQAKVMVELGDRGTLEEQQRQVEMVDGFMQRWFRSADGKSFSAASWSFIDSTEFEAYLEEHLRALLRKRLTRPDDLETPATITWHQGSPYRGLESFDIEHAAIFFGRTRARNEVRERLTRQIERAVAFVLLVGASGSGKSSLVKAGVLPDLLLPGMIGRAALCRYVVVRPSVLGGATDPLVGLAQALFTPGGLPELAVSPLGYTPERLHRLLAAAPVEASLPIRQGLDAAGQQAGLTGRGEARLIVIVDQFEELFTAGIAPEARERYVDALDALSRSGLVWVIATIRSDFYDRVAAVPALAALSAGEATYLLTPPDPREIGQLIRRPAREAGLRFETDEKATCDLDEVIEQAAAANPGSLPLLSYLLDQLWQRRSADGVLTFAAYDDLHGLEGAIGKRAEDILGALPQDVQAAFPVVLRALVTIASQTAVATARLVPLAAFIEGGAERRLVEALIGPQARILVVDGDGSATRVRVAHEALLTHWERARLQIVADRRDIRARVRLEEAEAQWREATATDRDSLLLAPGLPLSDGLDLVQRRGGELDPALVRFVETSSQASRAAERRRTRVRQVYTAALGVAAIIATVFALVGWTQWRQAKLANEVIAATQRITRLTRTINNTGTSAQLRMLLAVHLVDLNKDLTGSSELDIVDGIRRQLIATSGRPLLGHEMATRTAAFSPDGHWLATGSEEGVIRLWDLSRADPTDGSSALHGHGGAVHVLAFSADSGRLLSGTDDGTVRVFRLTAGGAEQERLFDESRYGAIRSLAISPNGDWLVFGTQSGNLCIWRMAADGPQEAPCDDWKDDVPVMQITFSRQGRWLATSCTGACKTYGVPIRLWTVSGDFPRRPPRRLSPMTALNEASLTAMAFNADETRLAAAYGNVAELWDLTQDKPQEHVLGTYGASGGWISSLGLSPDNRWLAVGSGGDDVLLWDLTGSRAEAIALKGHSAAVTSAVFSDDGRWLATSSTDTTARLWDMTEPTRPSMSLSGQDLPIAKVMFGAGAAPRHLLAVGDEPRARLWTLPDPQVDPVVMRGQVKPLIVGMAVSADGHWIATSSVDDPKLVLWSSQEPRHPDRELPLPAPSHAIAFSRDGRWLAAKSQDKGVISLWTMADLSKPPELLDEHEWGDVRTLRFSPDSRWLVSGTRSGLVNIWDVSQVSPVLARQCRQREGVRELTFSADGRTLATAAQGRSARLWNMASPDPCQNPRVLAHGNVVYQVAFSPDGRWAATAGFDQTGKVWDLSAGSEPKLTATVTFGDRVLEAAFSPDNRWVAFGSWDQSLQLLDLTAPGPSQPAKLIGHLGRISSVSFSPDGKWLVSTSEDHTIRLWDPSNPGAAPIVLRGHEASVQQLAFSQDSRWAISSAFDGTVRLWRLKLDDLVDLACQVAGRTLTMPEAHTFLGDHAAQQPCARAEVTQH